MSIQHITEERVFDKVLEDNELVMVKFTAAWCGPCQIIAPIFEQLSKQTANVKCIEVDVDHSQSIAAKHSVSSMPTFVGFHKQKEVKRIVGANPHALSDAIAELSQLNPNATINSGSSQAKKDNSLLKEIEKYIPKGQEVLNDVVMIPASETLNVLQLHDDQTRKLFELGNSGLLKPTLVSDADSQILIYIPFMNKTKIHTLLIKSVLKEDSGDGNDYQKPEQIKVWANTTGTLSFEDAAAGDGALHESEISSFDENGWAHIPLRYVKFQGVGSILIFIDGNDEDSNTIVDKLVIIGSKGESMAHSKLEKIEH